MANKKKKTQLKTDAQMNGLIDIYSVFIKHNIQMFLSAGTMLGAVRDESFIEWDWNVSVCYKQDDFKIGIEDFYKDFINLGFEIVKKNKGEYICLNLKRSGIVFIVENLIRFGRWYTRPYYKFPARYLKKAELRKINGVFFPCPYPAEKACNFQYGENWKTPIKATDRNEVISPNHRIRKIDKINNSKLIKPDKKDIIK